MPKPEKHRICLAASGGGHLRQILDLEPVWSKHDYFIVTEETALSKSLIRKHPVKFVPHFAFGQARLGAPLKMLRAGFHNAWRSMSIIKKEKPDVVITTGAGTIYFAVFWAWFWGAKIVQIESFARFDRISLCGRMMAPLSQHKIVQSRKLLAFWPNALVFDPIKEIPPSSSTKKELLFATVGATLPHDRLVDAVAKLHAQELITEKIVAQIGVGGVTPDGIASFETLPFEDILAILKDAKIVVCHGGTGSLITALSNGCRVVAMPRLFKFGEVYDDHQLEVTTAFAARGLIEVANTPGELALAIERIRVRSSSGFCFDTSNLVSYLDQLLDK